MESKKEIKQASWPNNFTFLDKFKMIHVHQSITCYHFAMSWAETPRWRITFRSSKVVGPTPKVQRPDRPINWESSVLLAFGSGPTSFHFDSWTSKNLNLLLWVERGHISISNFGHLKFSHPTIPLISASRKQKQLFWSCSPSPQCSWREVPLEWSYDYPSRTWDFWWDFLWNSGV